MGKRNTMVAFVGKYIGVRIIRLLKNPPDLEDKYYILSLRKNLDLNIYSYLHKNIQWEQNRVCEGRRIMTEWALRGNRSKGAGYTSWKWNNITTLCITFKKNEPTETWKKFLPILFKYFGLIPQNGIMEKWQLNSSKSSFWMGFWNTKGIY